MGVAYNRNWNDIVIELAQVIYGIPGFNEMIGMTPEEWNEVPKPEQLAILQTMCDDILFALGEEPEFTIGNGRLVYKSESHCIEAWNGITFLKRIELV